MRIKFKGRTIKLLPRDVENCRKNCALILKKIETVAHESNRYTYYLTFLIIMHMMTEDLLDQFDPAILEEVFKELNRRNDRNNK